MSASGWVIRILPETIKMIGNKHLGILHNYSKCRTLRNDIGDYILKLEIEEGLQTIIDKK